MSENLNPLQFLDIEHYANTHSDVDSTHFPQEDPRNDYLFTHAGYSKRIPGDVNKPAYYVHERSGRSMNAQQYRNETAHIDRAMDNHYYPADE